MQPHPLPTHSSFPTRSGPQLACYASANADGIEPFRPDLPQRLPRPALTALFKGSGWGWGCPPTGMQQHPLPHPLLVRGARADRLSPANAANPGLSGPSVSRSVSRPALAALFKGSGWGWGCPPTGGFACAAIVEGDLSRANQTIREGQAGLPTSPTLQAPRGCRTDRHPTSTRGGIAYPTGKPAR
jgi:hypothetical protein